MSQTQITLSRLEASEDRVLVAFDLDGQTVSIPGAMTPEEARSAISTAEALGATRISIRRFDA